MNKTINKAEITEWLRRFNTETPLYEVDVKIMVDPYFYNETIDEFIKYARKNNWVSDDYEVLSAEWNEATDKITFIKQLNQEDVFRLITWHIRGERFCSGLLANAFDKGYIQTALEILQKI